MSFALGSKVIYLAQVLSQDRSALNKSSMDRTSASYKLKFGVGKTVLEETVASIRQNRFSLNIDESTSSAHKHVLAVLVSYYNDQYNKTMIEYLGAIELKRLSTDAIFVELDKVFKVNNIP